MAGHSHWARIKRAKAVIDARRGRLWSKLARAVIVAARNGPDPESNLALRYAIEAARDANMPKETIERAIKKGSGASEGTQYVELIFEGYGPGGAAILCTALTDNRNRTAPEIRKIFEMRGAKLGGAGSVARMFNKRGVFVVSKNAVDEDTLTGVALEAGADDIQPVGDEAWQLYCDPAAFSDLKQALEKAGIKPESATIEMVAATTVTLSGEQADRMMALIEALEEHDDVQNVYTNFEMSAEDAARLTR